MQQHTVHVLFIWHVPIPHIKYHHSKLSFQSFLCLLVNINYLELSWLFIYLYAIQKLFIFRQIYLARKYNYYTVLSDQWSEIKIQGTESDFLLKRKLPWSPSVIVMLKINVFLSFSFIWICLIGWTPVFTQIIFDNFVTLYRFLYMRFGSKYSMEGHPIMWD